MVLCHVYGRTLLATKINLHLHQLQVITIMSTILDLLDMLDTINLSTLHNEELEFYKSFYALCFKRYEVLRVEATSIL